MCELRPHIPCFLTFTPHVPNPLVDYGVCFFCTIKKRDDRLYKYGDQAYKQVERSNVSADQPLPAVKYTDCLIDALATSVFSPLAW